MNFTPVNHSNHLHLSSPSAPAAKVPQMLVGRPHGPRSTSSDRTSIVHRPMIHHTTTTVLHTRKIEPSGVAEEAAGEFIKKWKKYPLAQVESFRKAYNQEHNRDIADSTIGRLVRIMKCQDALQAILNKLEEAQTKLYRQELEKTKVELNSSMEALNKTKSSSKTEKAVIKKARKKLYEAIKLLNLEEPVPPNIKIKEAAAIFCRAERMDPLITQQEFQNRYSLTFTTSYFNTVVSRVRPHLLGNNETPENEGAKMEPQKRNTTRSSTTNPSELPEKRMRLLIPPTVPTHDTGVVPDDLPWDLSLKKTPPAPSSKDVPSSLKLEVLPQL